MICCTQVKWLLFCVCYNTSSSFLFVYCSVSWAWTCSMIYSAQQSSTFKNDAAFLTIKVHVPISIEVDVCQNFFQLSLLQFLPEQRLCGLLQLLKGDPSITVTVKLREAERNEEVILFMGWKKMQGNDVLMFVGFCSLFNVHFKVSSLWREL